MQITVARGQQELGVFSPEEVRAGLASGQLQPTDYGWTEGQTEWVPLSSFPGLEVAAAAPPQMTRPAVFVPAPAAAAARVAGAPTPTPTEPVPTSGAAIASLICGLFALVPVPLLLAIPAVICGHIGQSNIKRSRGMLKGTGMAVAGLIMGYLNIGLSLLAILGGILAGIALPVFASVQQKGLETKALANAKQIATACRLYAVDHEGNYPKTLEELTPGILRDPSVFVCPFAPSDPMGYEYYGAGRKDSEPNPETKVFLVSKEMSKGKRRVVVYGDTSGRIVRDMPELPPHEP